MPTLLFINPDQKFHQIYKRHFSNYFLVDSAFDGLEGLRMIKKNKPHLIVSEYNLPQISASTLINYVRSDSQISHIPFVILSQSQPTLEGLNIGANDWLVSNQTTPDQVITICHSHLKNISPKFVNPASFGLGALYV